MLSGDNLHAFKDLKSIKNPLKQLVRIFCSEYYFEQLLARMPVATNSMFKEIEKTKMHTLDLKGPCLHQKCPLRIYQEHKQHHNRHTDHNYRRLLSYPRFR